MLEENTGNFSSSKTKHDWYQTNTHVTITILIRNLNQDDVTIDFTTNTLDVNCRLADNTTYNLHLNLLKPIIVSQSNWKLSVSKLEIVLKKQENVRWSNLETVPQLTKNLKSSQKKQSSGTVIEVENEETGETGETGEVNTADIEVSHAISNEVPSKPLTRSQKAKNWDKIVKDLEEEEKDPEEGVDQLFRQIYEKGGEEVRRAMNKSFVESGGTVLSTNWSEVSRNKVDVKPPDGCEFKKWE